MKRSLLIALSWMILSLASAFADYAGPSMAADNAAIGAVLMTGANNAVTTGALNGASTVGVSISGTWTGTLTFQGSVDGTNWSTVVATPLGTAFAGATSTTANGLFQIPAAGLLSVRVTDLSTGTGTATVSLRASSGAAAIPPSTLGASSGSPANVVLPTPLAVTRGAANFVAWSASATGAVAATVTDTSVYDYNVVEVSTASISGTASIVLQQSDDVTWSTGVVNTSCSRSSSGSVDNSQFAVWTYTSTFSCAIQKRYVQVNLTVCTSCTVTGYVNFKTNYTGYPQPQFVMPYTPVGGSNNAPAPYRVYSASGTNATLISTGQHQMYSYELCNTSGSVRYFRFFNTSGAPTPGSTTPAAGAIVIPAGTCAPAYHTLYGDFYLNGLAFDITGGASDSDTTGVSAGDVQGWVAYK